MFSQQAPGSIVNIEQGCLACGEGLTLRVRHATTDPATKWLLTMKQDVTDRVVEIEVDLSERDGEDLWTRCDCKLKKTRYKIECNGLLWEVDKFLDGQRVFCVLAEVELPEDAPPPTELPPFISQHLLYAVKQGDKRFSNKKLWHISSTESLYDEF